MADALLCADVAVVGGERVPAAPPRSFFILKEDEEVVAEATPRPPLTPKLAAVAALSCVGVDPAPAREGEDGELEVAAAPGTALRSFFILKRGMELIKCVCAVAVDFIRK